MKRWMTGVLSMLLLCSGAALAGNAAVPNPLREATPEEILDEVGAWMQPPENAGLISWFLTDGDSPMGEMLFVLDDVECSYRAQAAGELVDISGVNYALELRETMDIGGNEGVIETYADEEASVGVALWYDDEAAITYSLAMMSDATVESLLDLARTLYLYGEQSEPR